MLRSGQPSAGGDGVPLAILLRTLASDWRGRLPSAVAVIAGPAPVAFFLVVGSHRFFDCGFTQPVGLTQPHLPEILPMIEVDCCWHDFPAVGRWAHVTGRPVSVWLVVPQVQQRMSPALCWSTVYIQPGCPCVIESSPPLAVFATKSQPDPSSNLSVPSCALPSHPAQRHPQILSPSAEFFQDDRPISAFSFLPACPSAPSSQSPAYRASSIKRAPGRSRPTVQQDSKNQHHPAIRVAPHYQIKLSMRTIRPRSCFSRASFPPAARVSCAALPSFPVAHRHAGIPRARA